MAKTKKKAFDFKELGLAADPNKGKRAKRTTRFVEKLEREASKPTKKRFKFSKSMVEDLEYYIEKYNSDYESMARDKRNIYQDSPGQLRYKIKKYKKIHLGQD
jgi:hypothetical protein